MGKFTGLITVALAVFLLLASACATGLTEAEQHSNRGVEFGDEGLVEAFLEFSP